MESSFALATHGKRLWTREKAVSIREAVEKRLQDLEAGDVLVIDLKGVEVFDFSFANEFFCRLAIRLPTEFVGRFLVVEGLNAYTEENLQRALESVGVQIVKRKGSTLSLIGKVHPADQETFQAIARIKGQNTSAKLAESFGINLTAMNERLSKLTGLGLVRREKSQSPAGREQYVYSVLS